MTGLALGFIGAVLALSLVVWGLIQAGADDNAIVYGMVGFGLALCPWAMFWLMRPRRRPDASKVAPARPT